MFYSWDLARVSLTGQPKGDAAGASDVVGVVDI